jgi:hypothetical protein
MSALTTAADSSAAVAAVPLVQVHPTYATWAPVWQRLVHVFEGSGGFLDGTYLVAHPREWEDYNAVTPAKPTKKLLARRTIARYENVASVILEQKRAALFRQLPSRTIGGSKDTTKDHPLHAWWQNVDGRGTNIDDYMSQSWVPTGLFGHLVHVMDRPKGPKPLTMADQKAPFLRTYSPLDLSDWLTDDLGCLSAVKLLEVAPRMSLDEPASPMLRYRQRIITKDAWKLQNSSGQTLMGEAGAHGFGRLPVVIQYSKRRALQPVIGQSVLNDPALYVDLYNLTSELRELLRNQTFSILNVVLGTGENAISAQKAIELLNATGGIGTENVLLSAGSSGYITADAGNVEVYQKERGELLRTIYRLASVPWEADSRDAEAAGSLKLKREDMNQILAGYADECEKAEYQFVELWFRGTYGQRWEQELKAAEVVIRYPDTFDVTPFAEVLEQAQAAVALEMPPRFMQELRRRLVAKFLPDAPADLIKDIDGELEKMAKENPEQALARAKGIMQKLAGPGSGYGHAGDGAAAAA